MHGVFCGMIDPLYRPHILDHARHPRHKGVLADATHSGREVNASCGDVCEMTLVIPSIVALRISQGDTEKRRRVEGSHVTSIMFDGQGCALSTAAGSLLCESIEGRPLAVPSDEEFLQLLGVEVTSGRRDCALLPLRALRKALG